MNCFRTERVGFKTAVQKAAFKDDKVCHTFKFTSVTSVCCFSLSPSCLSVPPASLLFLPAPFFTSSTALAMQESHHSHHHGAHQRMSQNSDHIHVNRRKSEKFFFLFFFIYEPWKTKRENAFPDGIDLNVLIRGWSVSKGTRIILLL